jgi:hypothetical protein
MKAERSCRGCGCTESHACAGGCRWVAPTLCSSCLPHDVGAAVGAMLLDEAEAVGVELGLLEDAGGER